MMDEHDALKKAIEAAGWSGCQKSQRGVAIWRRSGGLISQDTNRPAAGRCDGSDACRRSCGKLCIHAEANAILSAQQWGKPMRGGEMIHVKVVDGQAVPSGPPSCWQCSRTILRSGLEAMWLLHANEGGDPVLVRYTATEFHDLTLRYCRIHPYDVQPGDMVKTLRSVVQTKPLHKTRRWRPYVALFLLGLGGSFGLTWLAMRLALGL